jgi:ankyrin repeat protein
MSHAEFIDAVFLDDLPRVMDLLAEDPEVIQAVAEPRLAPDQAGGFTALHLAAYRGNVGLIRVLVKSGGDLEARNADGRTPLHVALEYNNKSTDILIELGATLDICAAAALAKIDRLRELLDADPDLANDRSTNLSPMGWAAYFGAVESIEELVSRGARLDDGSLLCAASVNAVAAGQALVAHGVDPSAVPPEWGGNALHAAVAMRYTDDSTDFVRFLLDRGVDVQARTLNGKTALDIAREASRAREVSEVKQRAYEAIVSLLKEHGATE